MNNKPVLWNKRDYFMKLSKDDLTDFLKFRDAHCLLNTKEKSDICVVPVCRIVTRFMNAKGYTFRSVEIYMEVIIFWCLSMTFFNSDIMFNNYVMKITLLLINKSNVQTTHNTHSVYHLIIIISLDY